MRHANFVRRATTLSVAAATSLLGFLLFPTSAFAVFGPAGGGSSPAVGPQTTSPPAHAIVTGGMAGWQITLIAVGAALLAGTLAIFMDRARTAHQTPRVSAA